MKEIFFRAVERVLSTIIEREKNTLYTVTMYQPHKPDKLKEFHDKTDK